MVSGQQDGCDHMQIADDVLDEHQIVDSWLGHKVPREHLEFLDRISGAELRPIKKISNMAVTNSVLKSFCREDAHIRDDVSTIITIRLNSKYTCIYILSKYIMSDSCFINFYLLVIPFIYVVVGF